MRGQIVGQPLVVLAQELGLAGADLFLKLAQRRFLRRLAIVDAALRHLPAFDGLLDPLADEDEAFLVQQHHADAGAIGQFLMLVFRIVAGHAYDADYLPGPTMAEAGTRTKPRPPRPWAQAPILSTVTGYRKPVPA